MLGSSFLVPSKVEAGALTGTQISNVINLLQQYGVTANTQATVQTLLGSTSATGTTTTTTTSSTNGCTGGYIFNIYTGAPCPTTAAGTTSTTTSTTTSPVNPNAQYPYGTTGTTNTTTTTTNTTNVTATNGCTVNNQTSISAYNIVNGLPCVKVCTGVPAWNIVSNAICIYNNTVTGTNGSSVGVTVIYPNGGEDFTPGQTVGMKWNSTGISATNEKVFILLNYYDTHGNFVTNEKLAENTLNDGGELVKLPTTLPSGAVWGKNFTVTVGIPSLATDSSDSKFNIE